MERLIPWIFKHADTAEENHMDDWSEGGRESSGFFSMIFLSIASSRTPQKKRVEDASPVMSFSKLL